MLNGIIRDDSFTIYKISHVFINIFFHWKCVGQLETRIKFQYKTKSSFHWKSAAVEKWKKVKWRIINSRKRLLKGALLTQRSVSGSVAHQNSLLCPCALLFFSLVLFFSYFVNGSYSYCSALVLCFQSDKLTMSVLSRSSSKTAHLKHQNINWPCGESKKQIRYRIYLPQKPAGNWS